MKTCTVAADSFRRSALALGLVVALPLAACGGGDENKAKGDPVNAGDAGAMGASPEAGGTDEGPLPTLPTAVGPCPTLATGTMQFSR
jgi:hypothetical protein